MDTFVWCFSVMLYGCKRIGQQNVGNSHHLCRKNGEISWEPKITKSVTNQVEAVQSSSTLVSCKKKDTFD